MEAAISASQGAMRSLPGKLELLLSGTKYGLRAEEKKKILILQGELQGIIDNYLMEPSEVESPALTASSWMLDLRDLSYDIDDFIDELAHVCGGGARISVVVRKPPRIKISRFPEKLQRLQWITEEISGFRMRVKEAIEWHKEYLGDCKWRPSSSSSGLGGRRPLQSPCSKSGIRLVGLDTSIKQLCGWLANDGRLPEHRVASIVGSGGVGKTTLAKETCRKLGGQFDCLAFVRTSRKPDTKVLLASILSQVQQHQLPDAPDEYELVFEINKHLKDKTYLIVIDDMWELSTWDIVNRALPKGNVCSRILTTTEVNVIAQKCCGDNSKFMSAKKEDNSMHIPSKSEDNYRYIINKGPLCEDESRELFFSTAFGQKAECLPQRFKDVSNEIIKRSGGLPLVVKILASLLAHRPDCSLEQWNYIKDSLGSGLTTLEVINQVLKLVYDNLPHGLKACMLYLCMYEEDCVILKDDLVKQWITEGFISRVEGDDGEEVARSYFDELVSRGIIHPVDINCNDEILSCCVHHMVLDFIRYKSIEENFSIALDHSQTSMKLADKVRRLSLHFGNVEDATPPTPACMRLSKVRSLAFSGFLKCMPSIVELRFLQVLILKLRADPDSRRVKVTGSDDLSSNITGSDDLSGNITGSDEHDDLSYNLTEISQLFRLRYFRLDACHLIVELPTQMQRLKDLVAWEIDAEVTSVPSDIVDLPGLFYVSLPSEAYLPTGIGRMTSLRTLGVIDLSKNWTGNVMSLGELTNLQDLRLTCSTLQTDNLEKNLECLGSIIRKLSNLKCVTLVPAVYPHVDTQDDATASSMSISWHGFSTVPLPPALLRRLELSRRCCIFSNLPGWTKELTKLCILKIAIRKVSSEDVIILKGLPSLTALSLFIWTVPVRRIVFDNEGFSVLKYFKFVCAAPCLEILDGAMTNVRMLKLGFNANRLVRYSLVDAGFEHLISLNEISTKIGGPVSDEYRRYAKSVLTDAISNHPSTPIINVKCVDWNFSGDEEKYIEAQKGIWNQTPERDDVAEEESSDEHGIQENSLEGGAKEQVDMRTCTPLESTSSMQITCGASGKRGNPYAGTEGDEQASDRTKTLQVADATLQKAAGEARDFRSREVDQDRVIAHNVQDTEIEVTLDAKQEAEQGKLYVKDDKIHQMGNWDEASVHFSQDQYAKGKHKTAAHSEHDDRTELDIQGVSMKNGISTEGHVLSRSWRNVQFFSLEKLKTATRNFHKINCIGGGSFGPVYKGNQRNVQVFSLKDLEYATRNFHTMNCIGRGDFGPVYKGNLKDGTQVAIKRISAKSKQGANEFLTMIDVISNVRHPNLVKLMGCCVEGNNRLLVYEYVKNNSLYNALLGPKNRCIPLNWKRRAAICTGTASGLAFLHEEVKPHIIHRAINASNILLDERLLPKIKDFGLDKLFPDAITHISSRVAETMWYLAPEYAVRGHLTRKADTYSFGVLLLEVISGECSSKSTWGEDMDVLVEWTWKLGEEGRLLEIVDPDLEEYPEDEVLHFIKVALLCVQATTRQRPSMQQVVHMLSNQTEINLGNAAPPGTLKEPRHKMGSLTLDTSSSQKTRDMNSNQFSMTEVSPR